MTAGTATFSPVLAKCGEDGALLALRAGVREQARDLPGIYRMLAPGGEVLYIGKSKRVRSRLLSYFRCAFPDDKGARILREAQYIEWDYAPSEFAALLLELREIKRFRPRFNVRMKRDARHYAFIKLVRGKAPRLQVVRGGNYDHGATYYGPFVGASNMEDAIRELNDLLGLRDCSLDKQMHYADQQELFNIGSRTPGCVRYEIGKCLGPCVGACTADEYLASVQRARAFLDGTDEEPLVRLRTDMLRCSEAMEYERAATLRDKLERLEVLHTQFRKLRFAAESLSFLYAVPGVSGDDRIYVIRRGQVRAECALPQSPADSRTLNDLSESIFSHPVHKGSAIPTHEIDELLLLSSWFSRNPSELARTVAPSEVKPKGMARSLRKLVSAA
jgi:excinuclease ABC subunit C